MFIRQLFLGTLLIMSINYCVANDDRVTLKNVDAFEQKMRADLPIGSTKEEVENYLIKKGIQYQYFESDKTFYAGIPKIGRRMLVYNAYLSIKIKLNDSEQLQALDFRVIYDGL